MWGFGVLGGSQVGSTKALAFLRHILPLEVGADLGAFAFLTHSLPGVSNAYSESLDSLAYQIPAQLS